tara:strand:- start:27 stop:386 length:360 start_codon:yes stop_codon:yes gene_type:complete
MGAKEMSDEDFISFQDDFYNLLEKYGVDSIDCEHPNFDSICDIRNKVAEFIEKENFDFEMYDEDEINAIGLIQQALIFTRNNSNKFFSTGLMKATTYEQHHLERLTNNYINHNKLSIEE